MKIAIAFLFLFIASSLCSTAQKANTAYTSKMPYKCLHLSSEGLSHLSALFNKASAAIVADSLLSCFYQLKTIKENLNKKMVSINIGDSNDLKKFSCMDSCAKQFDKQYPFVKFTWTEEGTRLFLTYNYKWFINRAQKTEGNADDSLFVLLKDIWGESGEDMISFPPWLIQKTDIQGSSNLGDGIYLRYLKRINSINKNQFPKGNSVLKDIDSLLIEKITWGCYENSYEKCIKELNLIIESGELKATDKEKLILWKADMAKKTDNIHFNGNCSF